MGLIYIKKIYCYQFPAKKTKISEVGGYTLNYNEFIVYDTEQIKMKYLAKIKFNYKY